MIIKLKSKIKKYIFLIVAIFFITVATLMPSPFGQLVIPEGVSAGSCSDFDGSIVTCSSHTGCSPVTVSCSGPIDESSCVSQDDAYGGSCVWTIVSMNTCPGYSNTSSCISAGCTPNVAADCSTLSDGGGDGTSCMTQSECSYDSGSGLCSGNYFSSCDGDNTAYGCTGTMYSGACTGTYDTTPPAFSSASINNAQNKIILTFNETLGNSLPLTSDFVVNVNNSVASISSVQIDGATVVLSITESMNLGVKVTFSYTPGASPIEDLEGNDADAISTTRVVNNKGTIAVSASIYPGIVRGDVYYAANNASNTVSFVNTVNDNITNTISVGSNPYQSIIVGNKLYVLNYNSDTVSVIDINTGSLLSTISMLNGPYYGVAFGNKIYVNINEDNKTQVIDTTTDTVTATITVGTDPYYAAVSGTKIYVPNLLSNNVSVIDTNTNTVTATISVGTNPYSVNAVGSKVYVVNQGSNNVSVIDTTTNTVTSTISVGSAPYFSTVAGSKLYVANNSGNTVSVINTNTDTVSTTISVGSGPQYSTVVGSKLYVANVNAHTVSVINTNTNTVMSTINVGTSPIGIVSVGSKVYVTDSDSANTLVIDTITDTVLNIEAPHLNSITSSTSNGSYSNGESINITANFNESLGAGSKMRITLNTGDVVDLNNVSGTTLYGSYVVGAGDSVPSLSVMSISTSSSYTLVKDTDGTPNTSSSYVVPTSPELTGNTYRNLGDLKNILVGGPYCSVSVGTEPYQIATVDTNIYVANQGSNNVSVIDTTDDNTVIATIPVQGQPYGLAYNSTSKEVYVANLASSSVSVIDADPTHAGTTYNTVTNTITVGIEPYYVASLGTKIYVTNNLSNTVSVINTATHTVTSTISVGVAPRGIKAHGTDIYVANFGSSYGGVSLGTVSVIDSTNNTVTANVNVGSGPRGVAVNGDEVYVANWNDNTVSVISTASNTVTNTINVGNGPRGVLSLGSNIYVENYKDGTMSVIDTGTHSVTATVDVGNTPAGMTAVGTDIYVSRFTDGVVSILDSTNNTMKSSCVSSDITPPVISSVVATSTSSTTATITWTTDEAATSTIDFGLTSSYGTASSSSLSTTTHSFTLSSLTASSTYHYKISSWDSSGNLATTTDDTFTTQAVSSTSTATSSNSSSENSSGSGQSSGGGQTAGGGGYVGVTNIIYGNRDNNSQSNQDNKLTNNGILAKLNLPADFSFKKNASIGVKNNDILNLQKFLNLLGYRVSAVGAGSPGKETSTFGPATRNALIRFQKINNIKPAAGYFGPVTRSFINNLLKKI